MEQRWVLLHKGLLAGVGAGIAAMLLLWLSQASDSALLIAPFGASMTILFALPDSPAGQPLNILAAYILSTVLGLFALHYLPSAHWVIAIVFALSISMMVITGWIHPPAGAVPIYLLLSERVHPWSFLFTPILLGVLVMLCTALIYHRFITRMVYPNKRT